MAVGSDRVIDVLFTSETLVLSLADGCVLIVPLAWYPRLRDAPADARRNWRVAGRKGDAVHWPDIHEALNISTLLKRGRSNGRDLVL